MAILNLGRGKSQAVGQSDPRCGNERILFCTDVLPESLCDKKNYLRVAELFPP